MKPGKLLVAGSIAFDTIRTHKSSVKNVIGGSASYASIAASYFANPKLIAVVGSDFTKTNIAPFRTRGVDTSSLEVKEGKTFTWAASYDKDFKEATTLSTKLNVFEGFNPVLNAEDTKLKAIFLANIGPEIQLSILKQMEAAQLVTCDTMNLWIRECKNHLLLLLKYVDILFVNEAEARQLTGIHNLIKAGKEILKKGPKVVVIKLGPYGAMLVTKDALCQVPPYLVEQPLDTTGAGDSFGGAFTGYLASIKNWRDLKNIKRAMSIATVMASFAIESFSVKKLAALTDEEVQARLKKYTASTKL